MSERITVTINDRWGYGLGRVHLRTVEIGAFCPKCGGRRGEPVLRPFFEDGESYSVHVWDNPCGHVDRYVDVLREADVLAGKEITR